MGGGGKHKKVKKQKAKNKPKKIKKMRGKKRGENPPQKKGGGGLDFERILHYALSIYDIGDKRHVSSSFDSDFYALLPSFGIAC